MFLRAAAFFLFASFLSAATSTPPQTLQRLVLADTEAAVRSIAVDNASPVSLYVQGLPLLQSPDFKTAIEPWIGKQINSDLLNNIANSVALYARAHDRLIAKVLVPNQVVTDGTVRLVVVFGRFSDVIIKSNRWFSSQLIQERLGIKPGDEVRLSVLEDAVNWANTNPFRQVKVLVDPLNNQPGKANLIVGVQEVVPWRISASVDNYGTKILGQMHYTAGVQAGNLWGMDHMGSYMFVTTDNVHLYQAHVVSYRIPLPWRHFLEANISYIRVNTDAKSFVSQNARNEGANLKYTVPIRNGTDPIEVHAAADFKRGNNLLYVAITPDFLLPVRETEVDTFEFSVGGSMVKHDKSGGTAISLNLIASPGGIDARNSRETYRNARLESEPRYLYSTLTLQRAQSLGNGWELDTRFTGQLSSANLQGSEQVAGGGALSVRGYTSNIYSADEGVVLNNDLLTPSITTALRRGTKQLSPLQTRFAAFFDVADFRQKHPIGSDLPMPTLKSTGVGIRMSVSNYVSLNFDYGWQITRLPEVYKNKDHAYGHIKVSLAF